MRKVLLIMSLLLTMVAQGAWADGTIDITPSDKNKVLCTDGSIYNNVSAAEADSKTPVAKIIVVDTENHKGLALALSDEGQMEYSNARTACENKNTSTPVTNATWAIPSKDEWDQMITAAGSYTALRDGFSGIGGTNISNANQEVYWSRTKNTEAPNLVNWTYRFGDINSGWTSSDQGGTEVHVRFCLQFNLPIPTHNAALADGTPTGWSITPTTPEEGSTVTVSYTGQHRVKSVKVVKKAPAGPPSWKLTLSSPAKDLYITANGGLITQQTLDVASTEFTVEMPELTSQTVNIVATDGSGNCWYCTQENMSFAIGQTYQSSPTMNAVGTSSSADVYKMTAAGTIPAGKTAVLSGVTFSSTISCSGDATIILMGNNTLNGGLQASPSGKTMTITGTGSLNARSKDYDPGIGAAYNNCGNIIICGGTITAQPGDSDCESAGIGSGEMGTCGNITICGGTVTATGGEGGAGIGSGWEPCGTVTITDGATNVTATKGSDAKNSIGKGIGFCDTVTIDGVVNATTSSTFEHFNSAVDGNTWTLTHK